jgi:hypothetical protein
MADTAPPAVTLLSSISEKVKESNDAVREQVIENRVSKEINKRVEALDKALGARSAAQGDVRKLDRPDVKALDSEGKIVSEAYSEERFKELKKAREKLEKIDKAIDKALNGDFSKLNEIKG